MKELADFILQLFDKDNEEELWQTWLHKDVDMGFEEFKKKYAQSSHKKKITAMSVEEEKQIIANATRFIKPTNEGGEI